MQAVAAADVDARRRRAPASWARRAARASRAPSTRPVRVDQVEVAVGRAGQERAARGRGRRDRRARAWPSRTAGAPVARSSPCRWPSWQPDHARGRRRCTATSRARGRASRVQRAAARPRRRRPRPVRRSRPPPRGLRHRGRRAHLAADGAGPREPHPSRGRPRAARRRRCRRAPASPASAGDENTAPSLRVHTSLPVPSIADERAVPCRPPRPRTRVRRRAAATSARAGPASAR